MNFIRNLSMRGKLIVLMLPALLVIIVFAISSINRNMEDLSGMQQLSAMAELAALGDPLVEALQRERGRSAVLLASQQDSDSERSANRALQSQRQETDRALSGYRAPWLLLTNRVARGDPVAPRGHRRLTLLCAGRRMGKPSLCAATVGTG